MTIKPTIQSIVSRLITSDVLQGVRRHIHSVKSALNGEGNMIHYYHQVDDPYSHVMVQVLPELLKRYQVRLTPHLMTQTPDAAAPDRARLIEHSRKDMADMAPYRGLRFSDPGKQPEPDLVELANAILAANLDERVFLEAAVQVGDALWAGDRASLEKLAENFGQHDPQLALQEGDRDLLDRGHFMPGTYCFGPDWFNGVDRLSYLEDVLRDKGLGRAEETLDLIAPLQPHPEDTIVSDQKLTLEFFPSLRSPYSYIAFDRTFELEKRLPVQVILRPVLPMVMRGLEVPMSKRLYFPRDTKREASRLDIPFGNICDPVGRPVERCFSLYLWAKDQGKDRDLLGSFMKAVWSEGVDGGSDEGLAMIVERAGLSWTEAQTVVDTEDWRPVLENNREHMMSLGVWGVPSYNLIFPDGNFTTWGQDRLWLVEQKIREYYNES